MTDNSSEENVQNKVTNKFKKNVLNWLDIDDKIRDMRAQMKTLNIEKKELEGSILEYLEEVGEKELAVKDGKLRKDVSKTKTPLKKETILNTLTELTKDKDKAIEMTEHIINNRSTVERVRLKRTRNRKKNE